MTLVQNIKNQKNKQNQQKTLNQKELKCNNEKFQKNSNYRLKPFNVMSNMPNIEHPYTSIINTIVTSFTKTNMKSRINHKKTD